MRRSKRFCCLLVGTLAALGAGCGGGRSPVGEMTVTPDHFSLAWPELTEVAVHFHADRELPAAAGKPIVFVHLLDEPGSVVRTFDHALPGDWAAGRDIDYKVRIFQSALADPLPAGEYILSLGLYSAAGDRFALETSAPTVARLEYQVAKVTVPAPTEAGPRVRFSDGWLPPEAGADRQILARRSLIGGAEGTLQVGPLPGPGSVYLKVEIPSVGAELSRLQLAEGEKLPKLQVRSSCGDEQTEVSGSGSFDLMLPVAAATESCTIVLAPNFQVHRPNSAEPTSARLVVLGWLPAPSAP